MRDNCKVLCEKFLLCKPKGMRLMRVTIYIYMVIYCILGVWISILMSGLVLGCLGLNLEFMKTLFYVTRDLSSIGGSKWKDRRWFHEGPLSWSTKDHWAYQNNQYWTDDFGHPPFSTDQDLDWLWVFVLGFTFGE